MFYEDLENVIAQVYLRNFVILLGDFNARVGKDYTVWPSVIGHHGLGMMNDNGRLLAELCTQHNLIIINTCFRHKPIHLYTWQHPRSKMWHMIDHIIVKRSQVKNTRVFRSADCWSDHHILCSDICINIMHKRKVQATPQSKKLNVNRLKDSKTQDLLSKNICHELDDPSLERMSSLDVDQHWECLRDAVFSAASETLGFKRRNKDWFDSNDEEIERLLKTRDD